jgi:hypothetical protein
MTSAQEPKPPRNPDQRIPKREGESFPGSTEPDPTRTDRDRNGPLPEEETYERKPPGTRIAD